LQNVIKERENREEGGSVEKREKGRGHGQTPFFLPSIQE
jgi:hypothetical protein